jgi:hypothetical protein
MIRHFFPLSFALPVRGLPRRVKTRSSQRLLISRTVTPQRPLTRLLAAIVARAVPLPSVAPVADIDHGATTFTIENPIASPFHLSLFRLRLDLHLGYCNAYQQDIAITVAMASKAQGAFPEPLPCQPSEHHTPVDFISRLFDLSLLLRQLFPIP